MEKARLNVYVSPAVHKAAKIQAAIEGVSLSQIVEDAIACYVADDKDTENKEKKIFIQECGFNFNQKQG